ncbi:hypothetical protein LNP04_05550 [Chryseobacterium sp. C-71]|uniref:hypothetical protein n=1 Tax=Chryseobacterium sp. C-71 TaxID=2893882 RepID=UPI001E629AA6|nr:hypothetical protein [Chryseobacterium sp. C-71]UFH33182.1 hypothetical protein LNP04_05550 [Chryseobacterium sp. C-71]
MMRKNCNPISTYVISKCLTWKLGLFFAMLPILFSSHLLASENPSSETVVYAEADVPAEMDYVENPILYVNEGTTVYGLENVSQKTYSESPTEKKLVKKKAKIKVSAVSKTHHKATQQDIKPPKAIAPIFSNHVKDVFKISTHQSGMGMITPHHSFKVALLNELAYFSFQYFVNTNSLYINSPFIAGGGAKLFLFTRPPPRG